ncbi:MAG: YihY/virulence factor BrkB family protein [Solirubrobacteraceae bacterium]
MIDSAPNPEGSTETTAGIPVDRQRIRRTLTFWLRPAFVLRALNRFQRMAGFDRAIALASSALTGLIPLAIVGGALLPHVDAENAADSIIVRYGLTGGGAQAVRDVLAPAQGTSTDVSLFGVFLLVLATLSFSRGMQRLFEQSWDLKPLSVRNTPYDLVWIVGLMAYVGLSWWVHGLVDRGPLQITGNVVLLPATAIFLAWSGRVLSARRLEWRSLMPFAVLGAVLVAICSTAAGVYVPHLFNTYASRYGVVGAVLAMISALFALMVVLVASAAIGREVSEELGRIQSGQRPPDDEVRQEWDALIDEARSRWQTVRGRLERARRKKAPPGA